MPVYNIQLLLDLFTANMCFQVSLPSFHIANFYLSFNASAYFVRYITKSEYYTFIEVSSLTLV